VKKKRKYVRSGKYAGVWGKRKANEGSLSLGNYDGMAIARSGKVGKVVNQIVKALKKNGVTDEIINKSVGIGAVKPIPIPRDVMAKASRILALKGKVVITAGIRAKRVTAYEFDSYVNLVAMAKKNLVK
jgi:hypothetical protein